MGVYETQQCHGTTADGDRCDRHGTVHKVRDGAYYCNAHEDQQNHD